MTKNYAKNYVAAGENTGNLMVQWPQLNCLQPLYLDDGTNGTRVHLGPKDSYQDRRRVKTLLNKLAKIFAVDLSAAKAQYGDQLGRRSSTPVPLSADLILLPVKMRLPVSKDDGAWGYLVLDKVKSWDPVNLVEYRSIVKFKDGTEAFTLVGPETIYSLVKAGELVRERYLELHPGSREGVRVFEQPSPYTVRREDQTLGNYLMSMMEEIIPYRKSIRDGSD